MPRFNKADYINAKPYRESSGGWAWYHAPDDGVIPSAGFIHHGVRAQLTGNMKPPPGMGGAWYDSEAAALKELHDVLDKLPD